MKGILFISIFIFLYLASCLLAAGPSSEWERTFNVSGNDEAYEILALDDGSMVVVGEANTDGFFMKVAADGTQLWSFTFGGSDVDGLRGVTQKHDGSGFILVGYTRSYSSSGDNDVWIIETDNSGHFIRQWNYGRTTMYDNAYDIRPTSDGGYIIIGDSEKSIQDDWDVYLLKLDAELNLVWSTTIGTTIRERGYSGVEMIDGGFLIAGESGNPFQQDDVYLLKTDENGNKVWDKSFGGEYDEEGFCIQITPDRNYIVSGQSWSWGTQNGYSDMFLLKVDSAGNALWPGTVATFGGSGGEDGSGHGVLVTADNDYAETGNTQKFTGSFLSWLVKADADGGFLWETSYGQGLGESVFNSIDLTLGNKYVMAGLAGSDVFVVKTQTDTTIHNNHPQAQPDTFTVVQNTSTELPVLANDSDPDGDGLSIMWLTTPGVQGTVEIAADHRSLIYTPPADFEGTEQFTYTVGDGHFGMSKCRVVVRVSNGSAIAEPSLPLTIKLWNAYPNPFNPETTIHFTVPTRQPVRLSIFAPNGQCIRTLANGILRAGEYRLKWDGRDDAGQVLPSGLYIGVLQTEEVKRSVKLILLK